MRKLLCRDPRRRDRRLERGISLYGGGGVVAMIPVTQTGGGCLRQRGTFSCLESIDGILFRGCEMNTRAGGSAATPSSKSRQMAGKVSVVSRSDVIGAALALRTM